MRTHIETCEVPGHVRECLDIIEVMSVHGAALGATGVFDNRPSVEHTDRLVSHGYEVLERSAKEVTEAMTVKGASTR